MPKSNQSINSDLEQLLTAKGYDVTPLDSSGKDAVVPDDAELFQFHFHKGGKDYGTVTATIDGLQKLTLYYDDEIANSGSSSLEEGDAGGTSWISLVKQLKRFAQQRQLGFVLKDTDRLRTDMKKRSHQKKLEEGAVKELTADLRNMTDEEFKKAYKMTKAEARAELKPKKQVSEGPEFDKWANERAASQLYKLKPATTWEVSFDYGPHMSDTVQVKARSEEEAIAKVEKSAEKKGRVIMINWAKPAEQDVAEGWKEKAAGAALGAAALGGIGAGIANSPMAYVNGQQIHMAMPGPIPDNAKPVVDDNGKKIYVWRSHPIKTSPGNTNGQLVYRPAEQVKEQGVAEGLGKSIKRGAQGWGGNGVTPASIKQRAGEYSDDELKGMSAGHDELRRTRASTPMPTEVPKHSPAGFQKRVVDREMKKRGIGEQGVAANTQTKLDEGYYGNKKMSYSDDTPTVKMVIKHNRQLEETDQRFRHIEKIFLETSDGERFSVPTNKPSRARMFARHIAEGGGYKDDRWAHITEISEDLDKLGGFVRATNNKREKFNESAQRMINEAQEQYQQLRETVKKLSSSRGYNKYFESYEPRVISEDDDNLAEAFMHSTLDARIESALPTLSKFGIKMGKINESDMFAEWADTLVGEALDPDTPRQVEALVELLAAEIPVGPNAEVAIGELNDVIEDDELFNRLRRTAKADPNADARAQIISWMQEQDDEKYRQALDKIEANAGDSEKDQDKIKQGNDSDSEEPADVKPKKKQPQQPPAGDMGGLPPLPPLPPAAPAGLPPLPPLSEEDQMLESIKRLLGR